jgi:hypothetical protein
MGCVALPILNEYGKRTGLSLVGSIYCSYRRQ